MKTLFTAVSRRRLRKGAALVGLTLSLPLIGLGTAAPSGAAAGADVPFAGGLFSSSGSYQYPGETTFAAHNATTFAPTAFGEATDSLPDIERSFDGLAYNPVDDYLYTATDDGTTADLSVICNVAGLLPVLCPTRPRQIQTVAAKAATSADTTIADLVKGFAVSADAAAQITVPAPAPDPSPVSITLHNIVPGSPDLYRLDAEGDLTYVGQIPAPVEPALPTTPGIGLSHSAALGFAASAAADGTYLIPGIQFRASLDINALLDRLDESDNVEKDALAPIGSDLIDEFLPELVVEAGLLVGHVNPATAATSYVDVNLSAPACAGVATYAVQSQLVNAISNLAFELGLAVPPSPEYFGGLLDWAVNPANGNLYSLVTPGIAGLLFSNELDSDDEDFASDLPGAIMLVVNPNTGAATCTPFGIGDWSENLGFGGDAFTATGDLLVWSSLYTQFGVIPAASLPLCVAGNAEACLPLLAGESDESEPVIGDLASNPFPDLKITPTTSSGTPATPFGFTISGGGYAAVQLVKDQTGTYQAIPTKTPLTITDAVPAGFDLVKVTCSIDGVAVTPAITADSVTITVNTSADASCVFLHDPEPVLEIKAPELAATGPQDSLRLTVLAFGLMSGGAALSIMTRRRVRV
ncbi:MAG: hypothetical protein JWN61_684 [Pseudonocardiales bacterium]|nr:hypothetical protein [Pseudonocardiales bacterium]